MQQTFSNNYQPISKLPVLAKVLESLVNKQLKAYLKAYSTVKTHFEGFE